MGNRSRFYQHPLFVVFAWTVAIGSYLFATHRFWLWPEGNEAFLAVILFGAGLLVWMAFFSQFILPVHTFSDRQKIFERLLSYLSGVHGPAIFVENGSERKRVDEEKKRGPGVVWLDTASGAVLRTPVKFTRAVGPGVYFTTAKEYIAGTVDLHTQIQVIGPRNEDEPFAKQDKGQSAAEYAQIQERCTETSALTRDGIEVVPNIVVVFTIEAEPAKGDEPGSRFGYNEDSVFKAVTGEGINPNEPTDTKKYRVPWNHLPALLAADLWREYLSKFTLGQLFELSQPLPPKKEQLEQISGEEITPAHTPPRQQTNAFAEMIYVLTNGLEDLLHTCQGEQKQGATPAAEKQPGTVNEQDGNDKEAAEEQFETSLQTIVRMVKARLQNREVDELNKFGERTGEKRPSPEYKLLSDRGIKVIGVKINNLRFHPSVDKQLVHAWKSTWLDNARKERERINWLHSIQETEGKDGALEEHVEAVCLELAQAIIRKEEPDQSQTLKKLLASTRTEITRNSRLHQRLSNEIEELTEIIQWVDKAKRP
ncbi:MAG: hypothetical protein GXP40_03085 [Chloroflexi bacterium]|nr:hypothetical protein [Chloroflexota bacterium]